jgi:hypothetical protein
VVRVDGEPIGHVTTGGIRLQMLSLGGVEHLTGGSKKRAASPATRCCGCATAKPVEMTIDDGATVSSFRPARRPIINGVRESACGWAAARPPSACSPSNGLGHVDEVVVVDDHITGVLSEHEAGKQIGRGPDRHQDQGPALDAGALFPGGRARHRLGRHRHRPIR